jgi:hypothetical protein
MKYFRKFVHKWNAARLDEMYYTRSIPQHVLEGIQRTKHKWGFLKRLNDDERMQLATTKDTVDVSTNKQLPQQVMTVSNTSTSISKHGMKKVA